MSKPPKAPPHSDLDGVNKDQAPVDRPENSDPEVHDRANKERARSKGWPAEDRDLDEKPKE